MTKISSLIFYRFSTPRYFETQMRSLQLTPRGDVRFHDRSMGESNKKKRLKVSSDLKAVSREFSANSSGSFPTSCSRTTQVEELESSQRKKDERSINASGIVASEYPARKPSLFSCFRFAIRPSQRASPTKRKCRSKKKRQAMPSPVNCTAAIDHTAKLLPRENSFYSVVSIPNHARWNETLNDYDAVEFFSTIDDEGEAQWPSFQTQSKQPACACGFDFHGGIYSPEFPLITSPSVQPDSHEECLALAVACSGCWETILDRSESLDPQYRCLGLGMVKRGVMNRLAIQLTMFLEENDSILHCWIHTPLGVRHMRSNLHHQESVDQDPDAGVWSGVTHVVDMSIDWYCNGKPVRAIQQIRDNKKVGRAVETRCVLPDATEGKIMLFQFVMFPKDKPDHKLKADRILKYLGPKES